MNSKKVGSTGPFQTNPLYRSLSKGDVTTGSSSSEKKSADYNHFDLFGEPQDLDGTENLSIQTNYQNTDTSSVETSTAKIHFDDFADDFDSHIEGADANSSSEEPAPTPVSPPKVPPEPVQPAPQFSDDPAIAALQKSQHENTKNVVLYTELLQILNQALIDNPTLPKNSFDFIKGIFNQSLQQCTARVEKLSNQTQVALDEHAAQARSLAAQANGGSVQTGSNGTFSTTPPQRLTNAEGNQLRKEVGRIDDPHQQQTVVAGLRTALQDSDMVTDEQLDQLLLDMGGETEGTRRQQDDDMAALDKGLEQLANVQEAMEESVDWDQYVCAPENAHMEAIKNQVDAELQAEENEKKHLATETQKAQGGQEPTPGLPSEEFFDELDELLENAEGSAEQSAPAESAFSHIDFNNPFEGLEAETALFNEKHAQQKQMPSEGGAQQPSPTPQAKSPTPLSSGTNSKTNSAQVSLDERWEITQAGHSFWFEEYSELSRKLRAEEERPLSHLESRRRNDFVRHGGKEETSREEIVNLRKKKIIQAFQKEQENKIASIQNETIRIEARLAMAGASEHERQHRLFQLTIERESRTRLKEAGDSFMRAL